MINDRTSKGFRFPVAALAATLLLALSFNVQTAAFAKDKKITQDVKTEKCFKKATACSDSCKKTKQPSGGDCFKKCDANFGACAKAAAVAPDLSNHSTGTKALDPEHSTAPKP